MGELFYFVVGPELTQKPLIDKPIDVLMDYNSSVRQISALSVMDEISKVRSDIRLIGTPSSGIGSFPLTTTLLSGRMTVRYGRMMCWKPNGDTFDTTGVQPHITVLPDINDFQSYLTEIQMSIALGT